MPTLDEFDELLNNCTCEWTSYKGVNGRKFTSKKEGYTSKWVFLPAAGDRSSNNLSNLMRYGHYWTSSLATYTPNIASTLYFYSDEIKTTSTYYFYRYDGLSIRPVSE